MTLPAPPAPRAGRSFAASGDGTDDAEALAEVPGPKRYKEALQADGGPHGVWWWGVREAETVTQQAQAQGHGSSHGGTHDGTHGGTLHGGSRGRSSGHEHERSSRERHSSRER